MGHGLKFVISALVALVFAASLPVGAAERLAYDTTAFADAQKAGKSIVVHVHAPWCPTCKAQKPIIEKLAAAPEFKDMVIFELDFDTGGEALKTLGVRSQSTLIAFKGATETGRSVGDTNAGRIEGLMHATL